MSDKVTPKIEVNLRTAATTKSDVAANIKNGTVLNRTGIGSNGWSKINYNGKTDLCHNKLFNHRFKRKSA